MSAAAVALALAASPAVASTADAFAATLDARWDYGRPAVSETRFRELLRELASDSPQALEVETQIARAQGLQGHFDEARATLARIEPRLAEMPAHVRTRYLLERGRVSNSAGAPAEAVPLFQSALDLARWGGDDFYAVDAAHMLAIALPAPADRLAWNERALAMTSASGDARTKRWFAPLYNNLGWTYMDLGEPKRALANFRKALPAYRKRGDPQAVLAAHWAIGRALRATGDLAGAERTQRALLAEHERAGTYDGYVFEELAEIALARGEPDTARDWFAKAWKTLKDDPSVARDRGRLDRLATLGGITAIAPAR